MTMPTFLQPPKPGRPKRNPIDVLRTKVWFYAVKARSGLPSAYAIELAIEPSIVKHKEAGVVRPRKALQTLPTSMASTNSCTAKASCAVASLCGWPRNHKSASLN